MSLTGDISAGQETIIAAPHRRRPGQEPDAKGEVMPKTQPYSKAVIERYFNEIARRYYADKTAGHTCSVAEFKAILMAECERILSH